MKTLRKINQIGTVAYVSGIPYLPEKFLASYSQMREYNALHLGSVYYTRETSSWIPRARNEITGQIRGDWLFFLDTDLTFDPDCLEQMLRIMNKYEAPVVTGFYVQKKKPHLPILSSWNEEKKVYEIVTRWPKDCEIFQVDGAGAGCLLVKKFVFDLIASKLKENPFDCMGLMSEDMSFFSRLRKLGVGVYCAPQIKFGHLTTSELTYDVDELKGIKLRGYTR